MKEGLGCCTCADFIWNPRTKPSTIIHIMEIGTEFLGRKPEASTSPAMLGRVQGLGFMPANTGTKGILTQGYLRQGFYYVGF